MSRRRKLLSHAASGYFTVGVHVYFEHVLKSGEQIQIHVCLCIHLFQIRHNLKNQLP